MGILHPVYVIRYRIRHYASLNYSDSQKKTGPYLTVWTFLFIGESLFSDSVRY